MEEKDFIKPTIKVSDPPEKLLLSASPHVSPRNFVRKSITLINFS